MCIRYALATFGAIVGIGFIVVGAVEFDIEQLETILLIVVGGLLTLQSCAICVISGKSDRDVKRMVKRVRKEMDRLEKHNLQLSDSVSNLRDLNTEYSDENDRFKSLVKRAREQAEQSEVQIDKLHASIHKMELSMGKLENLNTDYKQQLAQMREQNAQLSTEIGRIETMGHTQALQVKSLKSLSEEQRDKIDQLTEQARNLNALQRRSVEMIQMLTLYGDDCKVMGVQLRNVSAELHKTDSSLGLTAREMRAQLRALAEVTSALRAIAPAGSCSDSEQTDDDMRATLLENGTP